MRRPFGCMVLGLILALVLGACQAGNGGGAGATSAGSASSGSASSSPKPAVTFSPVSGATKVRPDEQVVVTAAAGRLTSVQVRSAKGKALPGGLDPAGIVWRSSGALLADTDYTVTAVAEGEDGEASTETASFTTLKPSTTVGATLVPGDDWTVGVGMPIMISFSRQVKNRDAAVKALTVKTTPAVEGAWHWMSGEAVWWRPKHYWPSGTTVQVTAALGGTELAGGAWGRRTYTTRFTVGSAVISTVDVDNHTLTVTKNGKKIRVLPVTTGKQGFETRNGIKVIMDKRPVERMDAASTGTDPKDPEYYNLEVKWAMRLTWSGEYLHAAPWSVGSQGRENVSHGCTGMSTENAKWMYDYSKIGDVVVYENSSRPLEPGNGYTAWEYSWAKWSAGATASKASGTSSAAGAATPAPSASSPDEPDIDLLSPARTA